MAIYTKKGDTGKTNLFDVCSGRKKRVPKDSLRIDAIGSIDELNSYLGVCVSVSKNKKVSKQIEKIQKNLLTIGSILAGSKLRFTKVQTKNLEKLIDQMETNLPKLTTFIVPGGSELSARLQYARTLARCAERVVVSLDAKEKTKPQILIYINRLSDYLFMLAREVNFDKKVEETAWKLGD